jgi:hypothetical protein
MLRVDLLANAVDSYPLWFLLPSPIPRPTLDELDHDGANFLQSVGKGGFAYRALEVTQQLVDLVFYGQAFGGLRIHCEESSVKIYRITTRAQ